MTGKDNVSVNQIQNKLQQLSEGKQPESSNKHWKEIIRDKKGKIISAIAQDTNKNGTAGAPTKYESKYCQELVDFFNIPLTYDKEVKLYDKDGKYTRSIYKETPNEFPTYIMFAMKIGVDMDTLSEWKKQHPEFSLAYKKAKKIQESNWMRGTMKGQYNSQFAIFIGKNIYGYRDKVEQDIKSDGKEIKGLTVGVVSYKDVQK